MTDDQQLSDAELDELLGQVVQGDWRACEYMADNPVVYRADGQTLVMYMWPTHPVEETRTVEDEGYATLRFIAACPALIRQLREQRDEARAEVADVLEKAAEDARQYSVEFETFENVRAELEEVKRENEKLKGQQND